MAKPTNSNTRLQSLEEKLDSLLDLCETMRRSNAQLIDRQHQDNNNKGAARERLNTLVGRLRVIEGKL